MAAIRVCVGTVLRSRDRAMIDRKELLADLNMILELEEVSFLRVVRGQLSSALDWL